MFVCVRLLSEADTGHCCAVVGWIYIYLLPRNNILRHFVGKKPKRGGNTPVTKDQHDTIDFINIKSKKSNRRSTWPTACLKGG